ncbi:MAG: ABC transporter ATP-binding protein [Candidatus Methanomethylicia archaeon]
MSGNDSILKIANVTKKFRGLVAVNDVSFDLYNGEILGLVGPNGAGKTTLLNVINGIYKPDSGRILFEGSDITGLKPEFICKKGIARTFQITRLFVNMTVLENVMSGAMFGRKNLSSFKEAREKALETLKFVGFPIEKKDIVAGSLNVVEMKRVELARSLLTDPKLILLDEPATGLNPSELSIMIDLIRKLNSTGVTVLVVDHNMRFIMNVAQRLIVLHYGQKIAEGAPKEIANNEAVIEAYLGEKYVF